MKRSIFIIALILFAIQVSANNRWAIVVGISNYPKETGWGKISGVADVDIVIPMLKQNGFNENNIITLTDKQATKKGIEAAFDNLANQVKSGDVIYFHFSGHGQLITDLNNDERDEYGDLIGYDTALIPYDACRKYDPIKYRGENHIIDDELNEWLHLIKSKIDDEGSLIVVLDACHSGGATRDEDDDETEELITRGGEPFDIKLNNRSGNNFGLPNAVDRNIDNTQEENWICLSACTQKQVNFEFRIDGKSYGRLTTAIAEVLTENMTIKELIDAINNTRQYQVYPKKDTPQNLEYNIVKGQENKKIIR